MGHFDLASPAGAPFSTNATGLVGNLNADRVDNLHASEIVSQSRAKAGLDAESADTATTAANATQLGGLAPAAYQLVTAAGSDSLVTGLGLAPSELLNATVTTTVPTRILASASLEIDSNGGSDDRVECRIARENTGTPSVSSTRRTSPRGPSTGPTSSRCSATWRRASSRTSPAT